MISKERMMIAIKREKPDRLPVTIHQWQPYHLNKYMNGISDIEANRLCGLDASISVFKTTDIMDAHWKISSSVRGDKKQEVEDFVIHTPEGELTYQVGKSPATTWVTEYMIKNKEQILLLKKYRPVPELDKVYFQKIYDKLGGDGIIRSFICGNQGGCWQDACALYGVENLILETFDDPDWVHEFLQILLDWKLKFVEKNLIHLAVDLIETGGGASSNTVISPAIHEEFCLPYDKKLHEAIHSMGLPVVYHTCGGMSKITDLIVKNQCDVSETLSPQGVGGDIVDDISARQIYQDLHPHVALIGGMDQFNILEQGTPADIDKEVERLFEIFGKDGGYILSTSDHFFETPVESLKRFAQSAAAIRY